MRDLPFVSAIIVTRNEEKYINASLMSLINQNYQKDRYEIIVVDGMSDDKTMEKVCSITAETSFPVIRTFTNEKGILASGWNIGIRQSKGDLVVRIDAHAEVQCDFISKSVETMITVGDAVCVGGKLITKPMENDNHMVSAILSSPFGVGNSSFRVSNNPGYVDTAVYGLYKKSVFAKIGYFNENYVRNQDIELHGRIRASGGKFYFNPEIVSVYHSRNTVRKMLSQAYGNGTWNMVLAKNNIQSLRLRHLIPLLFVIFIIVTTLLGFVDRNFWVIEAVILCVHLVIGLAAAWISTRNIKDTVCMPLLFLDLHITYGLGYFRGAFIKGNEEE